MSKKSAPIGIFDSGIGGLTVVKAVREALPHENIIYFGDTARVPYGIKSEETVRNYALQITNFLLERNVKMILIACNTVSASAKKEVQKAAGDIPVLDVITAGTRAAMKHKHIHIGVIGTLATVGSGAYETAIREYNGSITITSAACPLLVPLAEEGWIDNDIAKQTLQTYLQKFEGSDIDSLILGCTHYPLFKETIKKVLHDPKIEIVDSALSIAEMAKKELDKLDLLNDEAAGRFECYVSDRPQRFHELAERFLGHRIEDVEIVALP
ncbi:glutamate racemase [Aliifodinibius sp. S!AR15-10]|uniref:glutamate racemase n=1 Tax=Aliifodinibius sp. S!AR15-10 TaxID=2950437 RepID=UPI0028587AE7|nr:glutamate racemase [Aliifodinibius sp. S!AR15-10]MDR8392212.1 glutamate racemase [Aliifodinibius sp. S!AR15-10]